MRGRALTAVFRIGAVAVAVAWLTTTMPRAQADARGGAVSDAALDQILDEDVRDGLVYYRTLKMQRAPLDRYLTSVSHASLDGLSREHQLAFWLNAYNALVLRTVVDHYPIRPVTPAYPERSIRQIPGAFERLRHTVAGRTLTLDQIEQTVLPAFGDPRVYLALGRGAVGGGRLRSEAYRADRLEEQLTEHAAECASRAQCLRIEPDDNRMLVSAIFSWREKDFVQAYADKSGDVFVNRSPQERAVLAFVAPRLMTNEREFLARNQFKLEYVTFDWSLNDLTGQTRD